MWNVAASLPPGVTEIDSHAYDAVMNDVTHTPRASIPTSVMIVFITCNRMCYGENHLCFFRVLRISDLEDWRGLRGPLGSSLSFGFCRNLYQEMVQILFKRFQ